MQSKELKTVVFYYTQSGQALSVARSICEPMEKAGACIVYKEIIPVHAFYFSGEQRKLHAAGGIAERVDCKYGYSGL